METKSDGLLPEPRPMKWMPGPKNPAEAERKRVAARNDRIRRRKAAKRARY